MVTTAVSAPVEDDKIHLTNIGDLRAYVVSHDEIKQIMRDHSYVQGLIDAGMITKEGSRTRPQKNIIIRSIGAMQEPEHDITLDYDGSLLLCYDGVSDRRG